MCMCYLHVFLITYKPNNLFIRHLLCFLTFNVCSLAYHVNKQHPKLTANEVHSAMTKIKATYLEIE